MLVTGVDMVLVFVTNMDRSVAWYRDVLELPVRGRFGDGFALLDTGSIPLALHDGAASCAEPGNHGSLISLAVPDYAAAKALLESRGCTFVFENTTPNAIFGTILDPDGTAVQISQRR
jgi:catechol 2,3-dioxygenase-like lactoylglutathione lyase family enzyme